MHLVFLFAAALSAVAPSAFSEPRVTVREEVLSTVPDCDGWLMEGEGCSFSYTNGEGRVTMEGCRGRLSPKRRYPGPRRMRGALSYVLRTDRSFAGQVTMTIRREGKDHGTNVLRRITAEWKPETGFDFGLSVDEAYYLDRVDFELKGRPERCSFRLLGVDAVTSETPAQSIRVDVETGNPVHLVRDGKGEKAELVLRNPSDRPFDGTVSLRVEDFFGNSRKGEFPLNLAAGEEMRRPMKESLPKGIRYVTAVVSSGGAVATNQTTWAYVDLHEVTPKQPKGEFRLGMLFHGMRYTPGNRLKGFEALTAIGAKLVRTDAMQFSSVRRTPDAWGWEPSDGYLKQLEERGLDLNAIIWWPPSWAVAKDDEGRPIPFVIRPGLLRDYGRRLGERYGTRVAYYEVGNEWDMSKPAILPYDDAVRQVRELAEGIKESCAAARVIPCGFASESSVRQPANVIRPMFHENLMRDVQDVVDAHPCHGHSPAKEYMLMVRNFLEWRERMGVRIPWYANETAVSMTSMRPTDRQVAITMWQKVLFAWSRGSTDYIWYNLRATGWDPADSEQGFGVFTADWHPRTGAASFAALASTFCRMAADGIVFDGSDRQVLRFKDAQGGKTRVVAGWDSNAPGPMPVRVRTDAARAWQVDTMGNRTAVPVEKGCAIWKVSENPSALRLEGASFATPDPEDAANAARRPVVVINPGPVLRDRHHADIRLKEYEQVYEVYKAMPEYADRTWRWWGDLWVWVNTAFADGKLKIRVICWDDVHHPVPDDMLKGDCAVLRLGDWKLALVGTKIPFVTVLERPKDASSDPQDAWTLKFTPGYHKTYDFEVDPRALGLGDEIPFNIRVYDNDGQCFKSWMECAPLDGEHPAVIRIRTGGAR